MTSLKTVLLPALLATGITVFLCGCTRDYNNGRTEQSDGVLRPGETGPGGGPPPNGGGLPWPNPTANPNAPKTTNGGSGNAQTEPSPRPGQ